MTFFNTLYFLNDEISSFSFLRFELAPVVSCTTHIFFDSFSANRENIVVTTLKINLIILKHIIFSSSARAIHNTLFWLRVKKIVQEQV